MGNHVFFYNDKAGRVERLNTAAESNSSYNSSLVDSVITSDWGRRPRSKYSSRSRPITPVQVLTSDQSNYSNVQFCAGTVQTELDVSG